MIISGLRLKELRSIRRLVMVIGLVQLATASGCSQQSDRTSEVAPPAAAYELFSNLGSLHHPIATVNANAQKFFDQGLTLVYAFNFQEAARSFRHASQLDPRAAMTYWGTALASGPNYNLPNIGHDREQSAYEAIQKAKALVAEGPENERGYIDALAARFTSAPNFDSEKLDRAYATAMGNWSSSHPDDPDAKTLYAASLMDLHPKQLWTNDGRPNEDTPKIVAVLEGVLERWPDHIGANHYYVHAMEASPFPERALPSARRLETLVPAAGHLIHMAAHIFARTGDYSGAVRSTLAAAKIDQEYLRNHSSNTTYALGYAEHNLLFLSAVASTQGNFDVAYKTSKDLESQAFATLTNTPPAESFTPAPLFVLLRFARWNELLLLPEPEKNLQGLTFYWRYARGCAFAAKGQAESAIKERDQMEEIYKRLPLGRAFGMLPNDWAALHEMATYSLEARIMAARGDLADAIRQWRAAVAAEDRMHYHEPPDWYFPMRESLGAALLRNGQLPQAEQVFRKDLSQNPSNPRTLFGLDKTLEAEGRKIDADHFRQLFDLVWKGDKNQLRIEDF